MVYGDFKDLNRRTFADKLLPDRALNIAKDPKYDGYKCGIALVVYKSFDKKTFDSGIKDVPNEELIEELYKPIIRKFNKRKVDSPFIDNNWGADLADL